MFTGLVETTATVRRLERRGPQGRLDLAVQLSQPLELGESISVSGACLTVAAVTGDGFSADVSAETLCRSTLAALRAGARVNIERAVRLGDRMGGHIVTGHVDGVGTVAVVEPQQGACRVVINAPVSLKRLIAPKGSITVDGVSLTVNRLSGETGFELMLVPHTLRETTLRSLSVGSQVNLEADVLARYVAHQLTTGSSPDQPAGEGDQGLLSKLRESGFC